MLIQKARSSNRRDTGDCLLGKALLDGFLFGGMQFGENADSKRNVLFDFYVFRCFALFHLDIVDQEAFLFINAEVVALVVD